MLLSERSRTCLPGTWPFKHWGQLEIYWTWSSTQFLLVSVLEMYPFALMEHLYATISWCYKWKAVGDSRFTSDFKQHAPDLTIHANGAVGNLSVVKLICWAKFLCNTLNPHNFFLFALLFIWIYGREGP